MGGVSGNLIAMYERQTRRPSRGWLLAPLAGITLAVVQGTSTTFWLGLRPFGLAPQLYGSGFALPFAIAGLVGAASALFRFSFRIALAGAILSIFSIGPFGSGFLGGLAAIGMILGAGEYSFRR